MDVETYLLKRRQQEESETPKRSLCCNCLQPDFSCYCPDLRPVDPGFEFVILNHPLEARKRFATGRMSHLSLERSHLIVGHQFLDSGPVQKLLTDSSRHCVILYPGPKSVNLTPLSSEERAQVFPKGRLLTVFVVDGTWATARQMVSQSPNLRSLPQICFTPPRLSNFRIRKQPAPECFSTIEAIHHTIELVGQTQGFDVTGRKHDQLLEVFDKMVENQLRLRSTLFRFRTLKHRMKNQSNK